MTKAKEDQLKFQIDQLRKDKIIYALESVATTLVGILTFVFFSFFFDNFTEPVIVTVMLVAMFGSVAYWMYMGFGNFRRLQRVLQLEKELYKS